MKLSDLFLNRWLYKDNKQNLETKDAVYDSANVIPQEVAPLASGSAAQDINTSNVTINGDQITPGTITLTIGDWGWGQTCVFSSTTLNKVSWTGGTFKSASGMLLTILAGDTTARLTAAALTSPMNAKVYIYLDLNVSSTVYQCTYTPGTAVGVGKVIIAVAQNGATSATFNMTEATQVIGDNILANSINASKIVTGSITATQISALYVYAGSISADQINAGTITGITVRTSSGITRVEMSSVGTYANCLVVYQSGVERVVIGDGVIGFLTPTGVGSGSVYGLGTNQIGIDVSGSGDYVFNETEFAPQSVARNLGATSNKWTNLYLSGVAYLGGAVQIHGDVYAETDNSCDLGTSSLYWKNIFTKGINLNGDYRNAWPTSSTPGLSSVLAVSNNANNQNITWLGLLDFYSKSTDPTSRVYGDMWHHYESGAGPKNFRGCPWNTDIYTFDMTAI